jgi:hypothetical protein
MELEEEDVPKKNLDSISRSTSSFSKLASEALEREVVSHGPARGVGQSVR